MSESLVRLDPDLINTRSTGATYSCPECGSFLDAPRAHPHSGDLARKCASCRDWYPVSAGGADRHE